jgi:Protein of unknown function (DUF1440)
MRSPRVTHRVLSGAIAGAIGAACMTVIRMTARRRGIIEKTVPQAVEEWLAARLPASEKAPPIAHQLADELMHVGYGAVLGGIYGLTVRRRTPTALVRGAGYGVAAWLAGSCVALPLMGAKGAAWKKPLAENLIDVLAHLVFGTATAIVSEEIAVQTNRGPTSDQHRRAARVG